MFENWYKNNVPGKKNIGTHWVLGRNGKSIYMMPETICASHAPSVNYQSIGIELANSITLCPSVCRNGNRGCTLDACKYPDSTAADAAFWKRWDGGNYYKKQYESFSDIQMKALLKLSAEIMIRHNIPISNLVRHVDVTAKLGKGHTDPGPLFEWAQFVKDITSMLAEYQQKTGGGKQNE